VTRPSPWPRPPVDPAEVAARPPEPPPSTLVAHPRTYRDDPTPALVPPAWQPTEAQLAAFGRTVLSWHQIITTDDGSRCTCMSWAVTCPYIREAWAVGMPVPWDQHRPPAPYREA
jgi:hypothetical protein